MSAESNQIASDTQVAPAEVKEAAAPAQAEQTEQRSKKRDENFRRMEQKLRETEDRVRQMEAEKQQSTHKSESPEDSDLVTSGQMKRMIAEEARKIANEAVQKSNLETLGDRLQAKHADFNDVVSEDAIEELKENHPEIFQTLRANPDPYSKALAAYKFLKMTKG